MDLVLRSYIGMTIAPAIPSKATPVYKTAAPGLPSIKSAGGTPSPDPTPIPIAAPHEEYKSVSRRDEVLGFSLELS